MENAYHLRKNVLQEPVVQKIYLSNVLKVIVLLQLMIAMKYYNVQSILLTNVLMEIVDLTKKNAQLSLHAPKIDLLNVKIKVVRNQKNIAKM